MSRTRQAATVLIAGWSGFFVMAVELLGSRVLAPHFGSSIYVWGALITVFMLALSLGYLLGGYASLHSPTLRKLAVILIAAAAALIPTLIWNQPLLDWLFERIEDPRYGSLIASLLLFLLPTLISGMVSPYAVRLLVTESRSSGRSSGVLLFVSTFGSALGTLATSFWLVLYFDVDRILLAMSLVSFIVGAIALLLPRTPQPTQTPQPPQARSTLAIAALAVVGAIGAMLSPRPAQAETLLHTERSLYRDIFVYDDGALRCLAFTHFKFHGGRQSCEERRAPQKLVFDYTKMMLAALYLSPQPPRDVLIIGLGGGTLPSAFSRLLPGAHIDVVEIDPAILRVAQRWFGYQTGSGTTVTIQDARVFVKRAQKAGRQYDLVLLDAFDHQYIPEHLLTREYLTEVRSIVRPGGVIAANTFSTSRLYDSESVTYAKVFGPFYNLKTGNRVILVANGPLPPMAAVRARAAALEPSFAPFGADRRTLLALFSTKEDWDASARILTDQYSPANLLNAPL